MIQEQLIQTNMGRVSVSIDNANSDQYILFMHGVYLDGTLWKHFSTDLTEMNHIYVDMPAHGKSDNVGHDWTMNDCVNMLFELMEGLGIKNCIGVGQSWGSMVLLRAANTQPEKFSGLALFNMPFTRTTGLARVGFMLQKLLTVFPRFYGSKAAQALYTKEHLKNDSTHATEMQERLAQRPSKEISRIIDAVILSAQDTRALIRQLKVPALAIVGKDDYVGQAPGIETISVPGGHISPHEAVRESLEALEKVLNLSKPAPDGTD